MNAENVCHRLGYLVDARHEVPDDPRVYRREGGPLVGCNQIVCGLCGARVRQWPGVRLARPPGDRQKHEELYATRDPSASPFLTGEGGGHMFRTYACRCFSTSIVNPVDLYKSFIEFDDWACGGHPA